MGLGTQQLLMEEGDMGLQQKELQTLLTPLDFLLKRIKISIWKYADFSNIFISSQKLYIYKTKEFGTQS